MRTEQEMVAYALETDPALLPYLPELLADLEELGSDAEQMTAVLADCELSSDTRVVDLGCGKGATAVAIARTLGYPVTGIELFEPFIACCERAAADAGVAHRCAFQFGNVLNMAHRNEPFDVAIFAALGDTLGPPDQTVKVIREYVRPGGLMIISDLYLADGGSNQFPGLAGYQDLDTTIGLLTAHGDTLIRQFSAADDADDDEDEDEEDEAELIRQRAELLAQQVPHLEEALMAFAASQAQENAFIDTHFVDAIWVLQRA